MIKMHNIYPCVSMVVYQSGCVTNQHHKYDCLTSIMTYTPLGFYSYTDPPERNSPVFCHIVYFF